MTRQSRKADFVSCSETEDLCFLLMHPLPNSNGLYYGDIHRIAKVEAGDVKSIYTLNSENSNLHCNILGFGINTHEYGFYLTGTQQPTPSDDFKGWWGSYRHRSPDFETKCLVDSGFGKGVSQMYVART